MFRSISTVQSKPLFRGFQRASMFALGEAIFSRVLATQGTRRSVGWSVRHTLLVGFMAYASRQTEQRNASRRPRVRRAAS